MTKKIYMENNVSAFIKKPKKVIKKFKIKRIFGPHTKDPFNAVVSILLFVTLILFYCYL